VVGETQPQAIALANEFIEKHSGPFEPEAMPNRYAEAVRELVQAKVAQQRPSTVVELETGRAPPVVNIMKALKESIQVKGH
jgi:DNA end-binding protein Ku